MTTVPVIHAASAAVPGVTHREAVRVLHDAGLVEAYGRACTAHIQLCVQHPTGLDEALIDELRACYPATQFRPHANVRLAGERRSSFDASSDRTDPEVRRYFDRLGEIARYMDAPAYTLHAGYAEQASLATMRANVLAIEQDMGLPVGVEGLYPGGRRRQLLASWEEYRWLLDSGLCYAVDLSHLNIVARTERRRDAAPVDELLASERCIEVHVSANDGRLDRHQPITDTARLWWWPLLGHVHPQATVFSEGRAHEARSGLSYRLAGSGERTYHPVNASTEPVMP